MDKPWVHLTEKKSRLARYNPRRMALAVSLPPAEFQAKLEFIGKLQSCHPLHGMCLYGVFEM